MSDIRHNYILPDVLDLLSAGEIHAQFMEFADSGENVVIDASHVVRITTPAVQIIVALSQYLHSIDASFEITNPSESFTEAFNFLGLMDFLKQWSN